MDRAYLGMDQPFLGLFHQYQEDPPLDFLFREDPPLDLLFEEDPPLDLASGTHEEGPALRWPTGDDYLKSSKKTKGNGAQRELKLEIKKGVQRGPTS